MSDRLPRSLLLPELPRPLVVGHVKDQPITIDYVRKLTDSLKANHVQVAERVEELIMTGVIADRPDAVSGGRFFYATDTDALYVDADAAWHLLSTEANWLDLTDGGTTTLHKHSVTYTQLVCLATYIDKKSRAAEWNFHGGINSLATAQPLDAVPTDLVVTNGLGKLIIVVNAGADYDGEITVTGTSVDRNTGATSAADTDTITVDALTTDGSDTDAESNTRHSFTGAYITSKWFHGSVTLSTTDLTLTDVDVYQVSFEQWNDEASVEILTLDVNALATNAAAWGYGYLYSLVVTGDKCDITRETSLEAPATGIEANKYYRVRRGNLGISLNGATDGFWVDFFPGPLNQNYWEDLNIKVWAEITKTVTST